jgi:nitrogen-specific signal transduction histidine kinase
MAKSKSTNRAAKRRDIDAFAEKLFSQFDAEPADITREQLDEIEADFLGLSNRRLRRTALLSLAQSGPELVKTVTEDRDTALAFTQARLAIEDYASRMHLFADLMRRASTRISVAPCSRPDMAALIDEVKAAEVAHV